MKLIKFDLPIDGIKAKNIEELRDHFTIEILDHYRSGLLAKWLRSRNMNEKLVEISSLESMDEHALLKRLCEIFYIEADDIVISAMLDNNPEKITKNISVFSAKYDEIVNEIVNEIDAAIYHVLRNTCIAAPGSGYLKWNEKSINKRGDILLNSDSVSVCSSGRGDINKLFYENSIHPKGKIVGWFLLSPHIEDYVENIDDFFIS